ncbi:MAG: hypothetical protein AB7F76_07860 [Parvibaculaceae bacterium]
MTDTESASSDRVRAIVMSPLANDMPAFAHHLAFETELDVEACLGAMRANAEDIAAARNADQPATRWAH